MRHDTSLATSGRQSPAAGNRQLKLFALTVVLLHVNAVALGVEQAVELGAFGGAEAAAALSILGFERADARLLAFEPRRFLRGERAVLDPGGDAMLLVRLA